MTVFLLVYASMYDLKRHSRPIEAPTRFRFAYSAYSTVQPFKYILYITLDTIPQTRTQHSFFQLLRQRNDVCVRVSQRQ
jgi:hypothetical protein